MQEDIHNPALEWDFASRWQVLPGMAHGLSQPVMLGTWMNGVHWPDDLARIDRAMAELVPEPLPPDLASCADPLSVVRRVMFWACAVQRQYQVPVFEQARAWVASASDAAAQTCVAVPYCAPDASWAALQWAARQWRRLSVQPATARPEAAAVQAESDALVRSMLPFRSSGYNAFRFLKAAHALDVPVHQVVDGVHAYGYGRLCRWLESSYTDRTPVIGSRIARDKFRTAQVLRACGLPAPNHARAASVQQAVQIAQQLGYPVVVKPADRDQGLGVAADLRDDVAVTKAFREASRHSHNILVEKHAEGMDYRLTVLHGCLIKTVMRRPAGVSGDGRHSIAELVEMERSDPAALRMRQDHGRAALLLDPEANGLLAQHGLRADTVPAAGQFVRLRRRANAAAGGTPVLITQPVHPDNQRLAERAALALQLDLAGVDLIIGDITRSWMDIGALVCEVNAQPQIGDSVTPQIYTEVLRQLLPPVSRIPVVLLVGDGNARTAATALLAHGANRAAPWAMSCVDGVWEGRERVAAAQSNAFAAARVLAASRSIGAAFMVMTPAQILATGLPFDRIDVLVMTMPQGGGTWPPTEMGAMWNLVAPAITRAIVVPQRSPPALPAGPPLDDAVKLFCHDGESDLCRLVLDQLHALGATD